MDSLHIHLVLAFRKILRPLLRLSMRIGLRYDEFTEIVKGAYIETAVRDGLGTDVPQTRARITLATGLPRREVDRFLDDDTLLQPAQSLTSVVTLVLHMWSTEPLYLGPYGLPLEIRFDSNSKRSIVDLVRRASLATDPHEVVDALLKSGAVLLNEDDTYRVMDRSFMVTKMMSASGLELFGSTLSQLATTFEHNLRDTGVRLLQRSVVADQGLPVELIPEFQVFLNKRVQLMLVEVDDWIGRRVGVEHMADRPRVATGVSVFHYIEPTESQLPPLHLAERKTESARQNNSLS